MMRRKRPRTSLEQARRRLLTWAVVLGLLTALALAWTAAPLDRLLDPHTVLTTLASFRARPAAPWIVLGGFVAGGLLALPMTLMVVLAVAAFGPFAGFFYALGGATLSGTISFGIGRALGRRHVEQLAGTRLHALSARLGRAGITGIAALRMLPVAHFTVASLVAGASHLRLRDFIAGTIIGMAPGVAAIAVFFHGVSAAARQPSPIHLLWLAAVSLGILGVMLTLRWLLRRR